MIAVEPVGIGRAEHLVALGLQKPFERFPDGRVVVYHAQPLTSLVLLHVGTLSTRFRGNHTICPALPCYTRFRIHKF